MISYNGQVRFAGSHEMDVYSPSQTTGGTSTLSIGATADTSQDFENVLKAAGAATGEDAYLGYDLGVLEQGGHHPGQGLGPYDKGRDTLRVRAKLRVATPATALTSGQKHYLLSVLDQDGGSVFHIGIINDAGTVRLFLEDVGGAVTHNATRAFGYDTWYDVEALADFPNGTLALWSKAAGEASYTAEVSQAATLREFMRTVRVGSIGSLGTSAGTWNVEVHSLRWQFADYHRCAVFEQLSSHSYDLTPSADLETGSVDFWVAALFRLDSKTADRLILAKEDTDATTPSREYQLRYDQATDRLVFGVGDGTNWVEATEATLGSPALDKWYAAFGWYSQADGAVYVGVNELASASTAFAGTPLAGPAPFALGANFAGATPDPTFKGRMAFAAFGKLAGGTIGGQIGTIRSTLNNTQVRYRDLSDTFKADSGIKAFWGLEQTGLAAEHYDDHGTNDLTWDSIRHGPGPSQHFAPTQAAVRAGVEDFVGTRIGDVSPTAANLALLYRNGQWRGVTHARIAYQAGDLASLSAPNHGAWVAVTGADVTTAYMLHLALTGLSSDQVYSYQVELSRDGATAHVQSDVRHFRTLPAVGNNATIYQHTWSCTNIQPEAGPNPDVEILLDDLDASGIRLHRAFGLGDLYYEWKTQINTSESAYTTDMFVREGLETFYDVALARLNRVAAHTLMPGDHEAINDGDSRMRHDATVRATDVTNASANGYADPQGTYPTGTTLGEIWDAAVPLITNWMHTPWLSTDPSTAEWNQASGLLKYGRVWELRLDTRWTSKGTTAGHLGANQQTWAEGVVSDFNLDADADLLLIFIPGPFTRINAVADSWYGEDPAELKAFTDYLANTVTADGKGVVTVGGDKHAIFWADRVFEGAGGLRLNEALKLNFGASPLSSTFYTGSGNRGYFDVSTEPHMKGFYDWRRKWGGTAGQHKTMGKSSGILSIIDQRAGTVDLHYWSDYGTKTEVPTVTVMSNEGLAASYRDAVVDDVPEVYYRLGEASGTTAADESGNGRSGTYSGSPTLGAAGALAGDTDTAVTFDGVDDYLEADSYYGPAGASDWSAEVWFKSAGAGDYALVCWGGSDGNVAGGAVRVRLEGGVLWLRIYSGATSWGTALNDGNWHHVVLTAPWGATLADVRCYIDNVDMGLGAGTTAFDIKQTVPVRVGRDVQSGIDNYFVGTIDEVAVYSEQLLTSQVDEHYQLATSTATTVAPNFLASTATVYSPTVEPGAVSVEPSFIASTAQVFAPTVEAGVAANTIAPAFISTTSQVFAPEVQYGAVAIEVPFLASTAAVYAPVVGDVTARYLILTAGITPRLDLDADTEPRLNLTAGLEP